MASIKEKNKNNLKKNFTIQVNKDSIVERVVEKPKKPDIINDSSREDPEILIKQIINKIKLLGYMNE